MSGWKFHIYFVKFLLRFACYSTYEIMFFIYNYWVQLCLYGNNLFICWTWLALSRYFQSVNYIVWTIITSVYLKSGLMRYSTQSFRSYLVSSRSTLLYCFYVTLCAVGCSEHGFNSMLISGLSLLRVVRSYKIYT